ncbi:hypothetical protein D2Q93_08700 [Alicyclobacillaceae bacterium I2511]|nr:hypothetical protein D2Q93_08700 [Alicyclobacillaceae bacterium I2511]
MAGQDTIMKALTRSLSDGALDVLGVFNVELAEPMPTELPANTLRIDKAWRMQDGRVFHLEFQSSRETTLHRFLEYDARLARQHLTQIRTVVLYHAETSNAPSELDIGTAIYRVENVFLSQMDGDRALDEVSQHLKMRQWEPKDRLRLALALNMRVQDMSVTLNRVLELVSVVPDETEKDLVVSAIAALGDHSFSDQQRAHLRRELRKMSKIAEELYQEGRQEGRQEGEHIRAVTMARKMLLAGVPVPKVVEFTDLPLEEVQKLKEDLH